MHWYFSILCIIFIVCYYTTTNYSKLPCPENSLNNAIEYGEPPFVC